MSAALWLVVLPIGTVPIVYLLRRVKLGSMVATLIALLMSWLALRLPTGTVLTVLGRSIELDQLSQAVISLLFVTTAMLFLIPMLCPPYAGAGLHSGVKGREEKFFYAVGLAILALFVAASLSRHLGITAVFIQLAVILTVFIIQAERLDSTRASLRFLTLMSLATPLFLLAAWRIDLYQLSGGLQPAPNIQQTVFFVFFGFALWLAVVPFHGWLTTVAAESAPATAAFVLSAFPAVAFSTLLHLLADLPWLVESPQVVEAIILAGVFTALVGGGLAGVQRGFSQLMGYAALYDLGCMLTVLGVGGQSAVITILVSLSVRALALILVALGGSAIRMRVAGDGFAQVRGMARYMPVAIGGLLLGGLTLAGAPMLAGFPARWQLLRSVSEVNPVLPLLLALGGLGVAFGYLQGLRAALSLDLPTSHQNGRPIRFVVALQEPPALLFLIGLLGVICLALGLFPSLLIEPLQLLTLGFPAPIR
ncbi:MAG: proton-conducting transporter membrane subunit [Chloroflexota bacterium]